ncbi:MAG TPA: hypothetical protein VGN44_05980 [Candidatus Angelobacter sp.]|jgi:hypothetical protein
MKLVRLLLPSALILALVSCKPLVPEVTSQDCVVPVVPAGFTRIFIGAPVRGGQQSGTSKSDPLDGTTADKFDTILRTIAEGQQPTWGTQKNIAPENLIVCLAGTTFQTNGQYDWLVNVGHTQGVPRGFTVEKNWKIHGLGLSHTKLQLTGYLQSDYVDSNGSPYNGGRNVVIGTHSDQASGVEVSDLTIDANHDQLTPAGGTPLNLEGIILRSFAGNHWLHNINVIGTSGDAGYRNIVDEAFAVRIWGSGQSATQSANNLVENVTVSNAGRPMTSGSPMGGIMDGIVVNNAVAEVRDNTVEGYYIAYGGWIMGSNVWFHDNISQDSTYGFNADSFSNDGIILQNNQFIHPARYGIVIGGFKNSQTFTNWNVSGNFIQMNTTGSTGIVLHGQVQNSLFTQNTIQSDGGQKLTAILSYSSNSSVVNLSNAFQDNHIDDSVPVDFSQDPNFNTNCRYQNRDLQGHPIPGFPDNSGSACK